MRQPEVQTASRFGIILLTTVEITPDFVNACLVANASLLPKQCSLGSDPHLEELLATHIKKQRINCQAPNILITKQR